MGHWELGEAFGGMPDGDLWTRPHPRLLSVGELAAHIAFAEDANMAGGITGSVLSSKAVSYYPDIVAHPFSVPLTARELYQEVQRVHGLVKESLTASPLDPDARNPWREDWTWRQTLEYMVFHMAYHTGQIYSVRHALGHETVDN